MWTSPGSSYPIVEEYIWDCPFTPNALEWTKYNEIIIRTSSVITIIDLGSRYPSSKLDSGFSHFDYWTICIPGSQASLSHSSSKKWLTSAASPSLVGNNSAVAGCLTNGECFMFVAQICSEFLVSSLAWTFSLPTELSDDNRVSLLAVGCNNRSIRIYSINHDVLLSDVSNILFPLYRVIFLPTDGSPCQLLWNTFDHSNYITWLVPNGTFGIYNCSSESIIFSSSKIVGSSMLHWASPELLLVINLIEGIQIFSLKEVKILSIIQIPDIKLPGISMGVISFSRPNELIIDIVAQPSFRNDKSKIMRPIYIRISALQESLDKFSILIDANNPVLLNNENFDSADDVNSALPSSYFGIAKSPTTGCYIATLSGYISWVYFRYLFKSHETVQNKSICRIGLVDGILSVPFIIKIVEKFEYLAKTNFIPNPFGWELSVTCKLLSSSWGFMACKNFIESLLSQNEPSCNYNDLFVNDSSISRQRRNAFILHSVKLLGNFSELIKKHEDQVALAIESISPRLGVLFDCSNYSAFESKRCYHCNNLIPRIPYSEVVLSTGFIYPSFNGSLDDYDKIVSFATYFQKFYCFWCGSPNPSRQRSLNSISPL